ncbi:MAG: hypothetical protein COB43_12395 [Oceanospirillales bacterium]|nr:MAG: hypothetical protein COB43_12395 [Oceanospirillales bacterium]
MITINYRHGLNLLVAFILTGIHPAYAATFDVQDRALHACLQALAENNGWSKPEDVTEIKCHSKDIHSIAGVEQFTQLQSLSLYNNKLEQLDVDLTLLKQLKTLNLARNNLTRLNLTNLPSLSELYLFDNQLETLTLSNLVELKTLKTNNNKIEHFTYLNMSQLEKVYIFNNKLATVDIYSLPKLQYMDCRQNPMPDSLYDEMDKKNDVTFLHDGNAEDW